MLIVGVWHQQSTMIATSTDMMAVYPPVPAILFLLVMIGLYNPLMGRFKSSLRFDASELVTVFIMVLVGTPLVGTAWAQALMPSQISFRYYATPENRYQEDFFPYIKNWFGPRDPETVRGFYEGGMESIPWGDWLPSLLIWALFSVVLYFTFYCLVILVKKQWSERERLSFPLLKLPLELIQGSRDGKHSFLRNKLTWFGVMIPFLIHIVNGLNAYFPGFPAIATTVDLSRYLTEHPWNAMWGVSLTFQSMLIGIGYLMNLEIAFSCWFFFLFQKMMLVIASAMSWSGSDSAMAGFPFLLEQQSGAFFALAVVYLWVLRRHLKESFLAAFGHGKSSGEPGEVSAYRLAWLGLVGGTMFIIGFAMAVGMSLLVGILFFLVIFVQIFVLTRLRAEAGLPPMYAYDSPTKIIDLPFGPTAVGAKNHTGMAMLGWILQDQRGIMMPAFLDSYKLDSENKSRLKGLLVVFAIAIVVGMMVGAWSELVLAYKYGANSMCGWRRGEGHKHFQQLSTLIQNPEQVKSQAPLLFVGVGAAVTFLFSFMRMRFLWWPFHPIGYAVANMMSMWSCIFFGWLARLVMFRLAGTKGYRRGLPFFLGMIMGDFIMRIFWGIMACVIRGKGYLP